MNTVQTFSLLSLLSLLTSASLAATNQSLVISPGPEAKFDYICDCKPDVNYPDGSNGVYLYQGTFTGGPYNYCQERFLLQWDLSRIPTNARIVSAKMDILCKGFYGSGSGSMVFARIVSPWVRRQTTFGNQPAVSAEDRVLRAQWPTTMNWFSVDITPWVQGWHSGAFTNHGFLAYSEKTVGTCSAFLYAPGHGTPEKRPKLTVVYQLVEPARLGIRRKTDGTEVEFRGDAECSYTVQLSTNLTQWTDWTNVAGTNVPVKLPTQADQPCRCQFFRARLLNTNTAPKSAAGISGW